MYVPPKGIYFRLVGHASRYVLFSRTTQEPQVWHYGGGDSEDQFFTLLHGTGSRAGLYAIKSKKTGKVLFSRGAEPTVGHIDGDGYYDDNWFELELGTGDLAKEFRLLCPASGYVLFSRTTQSPGFGNYTRGYTSPDQYFSFAFEDLTIKSVDYDIALGKISHVTPHVLTDQTLTNRTDHEQEMSFQFSESITHTSTFEYSTGFTITMGTSFLAGIPFVAEGEISVEVSQTNQWTFGVQNTISKTYGANFPVKAGPWETVHAVSTVQQGTLEVPYTIHLVSKSSGAETLTKGIWSGVSSWSLHHTVEIV